MSGGNTQKPAISQPVLIITTERKLKSELIPVLSQELPMAPLVELTQMHYTNLNVSLVPLEKLKMVVRYQY